MADFQPPSEPLSGRLDARQETAPLSSTAPQLVMAGPVATLTLNRPAHHNRLSQSDLDQLLAHLATVQSHPEVVVMVMAARVHPERPVFCSGFHLGEFETDAHAPGDVSFARVPDALAALDAITIAAINGSVYGGATDLALACDFRLGVQGMQLRMPAAALGLHFYPSGLVRYVTRWGLSSAKKAFLTAQTFDDQALLATGFLDELLPPEQLQSRALALAEQIAQLAPLALRGMKHSLNDIAEGRDTPEVWRERERLANASADFEEGRRAFAQRRPPQFVGR